MIIDWLKYIPGWPLVKLCKQLEYVFNVLNGLEGVNCRIDKPTHNQGYGWKIIVDGGTDTDNEGAPMPAGWPSAPFSGGGGSDVTWEGGTSGNGPLLSSIESDGNRLTVGSRTATVTAGQLNFGAESTSTVDIYPTGGSLYMVLQRGPGGQAKWDYVRAH